MCETNQDKRTYFKDQVCVIASDDGLEVRHTHWLERRLNFLVGWDDIISIHAIQIEPFNIGLVLTGRNNTEYEVFETMEGWSDLLGYIKKQFINFNWNSFEKAKGDVNEPFLCWREGGNPIN
ncbi:MAG: hypothetical protein PWQ29_995 [Verrucomicrobiota bacterium]|nr:hypothetical protein [Verrucomicrobiota bacterium]